MSARRRSAGPSRGSESRWAIAGRRSQPQWVARRRSAGPSRGSESRGDRGPEVAAAMSKARNRPPRLESKVGPQEFAPPPTLQHLLEHADVSGPAASPGPSELRRLVSAPRNDRVHPVLLDDAWASVTEIFGGTSESPCIDPDFTIAAASPRVRRIVEVAETGARIAFATSLPASLLTVYLALSLVRGSRAATSPTTTTIRPRSVSTDARSRRSADRRCRGRDRR